jgi:hypothetical protein
VPQIVEKLAILENVNDEGSKDINIASLSKEINELLENLQEEITG